MLHAKKRPNTGVFLLRLAGTPAETKAAPVVHFEGGGWKLLLYTLAFAESFFTDCCPVESKVSVSLKGGREA